MSGGVLEAVKEGVPAAPGPALGLASERAGGLAPGHAEEVVGRLVLRIVHI